MKIGILQTGHTPEELQEEFGEYSDLFQSLFAGHDFEFETYNVVDNVFPDGIHAAEGWLVTGSKHGAYEDHEWIPPLEDFIRACVTENAPMIGICFGHQIIAQALGGKVEKFDGGWAVGRQTYDFAGTEIALNAWHQDQVTELPPGAVTIASNDFCKNAAIIYGDRALTVQAHPEFDGLFIDGLINTRGRGVVPDDLLDAAEETLAAPVANQTLADQFADFFRQERSK
ncbi:GMP synthase (glutamine-hydrolysing) [Shimia isoporae]|uniref:GMP synthase (Glutamine-hydrolysing) n=1 Tax=Shimia isoporae TaxID=647720 RepID=A0A4R1NUS2_9RHOB|nr:type 1 glutamine amidotransferase [Shimia isoporae]TCL08998.1 GMP synthase (glutamine-hydrolysing) [Shimia isoporae]